MRIWQQGRGRERKGRAIGVPLAGISGAAVHRGAEGRARGVPGGGGGNVVGGYGAQTRNPGP